MLFGNTEQETTVIRKLEILTPNAVKAKFQNKKIGDYLQLRNSCIDNDYSFIFSQVPYLTQDGRIKYSDIVWYHVEKNIDMRIECKVSNSVAYIGNTLYDLQKYLDANHVEKDIKIFGEGSHVSELLKTLKKKNILKKI